MPAHPNRSRHTARRNPTPDQIREARTRAGLTQSQCAALLHTVIRTYQQWESGERSMHPAFWELLRIKIGA